MKDMKLGITLIAAAVALAGCGEQKPAAKAQAKPAAAAPSVLEVKIGHVGPLTGGIAHLGKDNENDATAYGEGIANEVEKTLKAANIKVLPREKGTDKTTDWKAVLTKLR